MTERRRAIHAVFQMEDDIHSVLRYAQALDHVASSPHMIEPECLTAFSDPLRAIGQRLREQYKEAHEAVVGDRP
ncbi:hypothetical protein ACFQE0_21535 [Methylobacterium komagatae]|uniref:Uncharacterized protein n=1 Tax=Methylobacterium komagatae TaxID=374425 RepID=A0ABW2BNA8_9HYPH